MDELLTRLERYYDEVPRAGADVQEHGPFTVFVARGGWPYYARPRLGHTDDITPDQVRAVLDHLERLGQPRTIEWVHKVTPSLHGAAVDAGLEVHDYPILVLDGDPVERKSPTEVRRLQRGDPDLPGVQAAVHVGFGQDDTRTGSASAPERDALVPQLDLQPLETMLESGRSVLYGAFDPELGPVGGGSHNPRGDVTEIVGVGVLPAVRRRGIAGHLTWALATDAARAGATTVFMSAGSDDVARVYEGVGFRRVGTACIVH